MSFLKDLSQELAEVVEATLRSLSASGAMPAPQTEALLSVLTNAMAQVEL